MTDRFQAAEKIDVGDIVTIGTNGKLYKAKAPPGRMMEVKCPHPNCNKLLFTINKAFIDKLLQGNKESDILETEKCRHCKQYIDIYVKKDKLYAVQSVQNTIRER